MRSLVRRASAAVAALAILFVALVVVSLLVESDIESISMVRRTMMTKTTQVHGGLNHKSMEDPFRGSKRRVPNGPDPIHNRGTGESGRSPGRA